MEGPKAKVSNNRVHAFPSMILCVCGGGGVSSNSLPIILCTVNVKEVIDEVTGIYSDIP